MNTIPSETHIGVDVVACMRKMIVMLNVMVRDGTCWEETKTMA